VRLTPTDWKTQVRIFKADGFSKKREHGDHIIMEKKGVLRPVIIPKYSEVGRDIIQSNMRAASMSRKRYFQLLNGL